MVRMVSARRREYCQRAWPRSIVKRRGKLQQLAVARDGDRRRQRRIDPELGSSQGFERVIAKRVAEQCLSKELGKVARPHRRREIGVQPAAVEPSAAAQLDALDEIFVVAD